MSNKLTKQFKKAYEEAYGVKPTEVHAQNTLRVDFYKSFLWRLFLGSVRIKVPAKWSIDFFRAVLLWGGAIGVTELEGAIIPFAYSVLTRNRWHYPITVQATGELADKIHERTVGEDCELIYLESANFPNCVYSMGVESYIEIYAQKLANCDGAIDTNLFVTRTPWVFGVEDDNDVQNMKALVNRIFSGAPAVYYKMGRKVNPNSKDLPILKIPAKENFITLDTQTAKRAIIDEFLTGIGINNANTDKRERLITSEVEANDAEINAAIALWQDNVNRGIEKVKALYGDFFIDDEENPLSVTFIGAGRGDNEPNRTNRRLEVEDGTDEQSTISE